MVVIDHPYRKIPLCIDSTCIAKCSLGPGPNILLLFGPGPEAMPSVVSPARPSLPLEGFLVLRKYMKRLKEKRLQVLHVPVAAEPRAKVTCSLSLLQVPPSHPLLKAAKLREEAGTSLGSLMALTASPTVSRYMDVTCYLLDLVVEYEITILTQFYCSLNSFLSSVVLMTCIGCLTNIAKQRPSNMSTVVQTYELLHGERHCVVEF